MAVGLASLPKEPHPNAVSIREYYTPCSLAGAVCFMKRLMQKYNREFLAMPKNISRTVCMMFLRPTHPLNMLHKDAFYEYVLFVSNRGCRNKANWRFLGEWHRGLCKIDAFNLCKSTDIVSHPSELDANFFTALGTDNPLLHSHEISEARRWTRPGHFASVGAKLAEAFCFVRIPTWELNKTPHQHDG